MLGLHLVRLGPNVASCWMTHIIVPGPLSVPSVLKYLPSVSATAKPSADGDDDEQQQQDGILFLGSSLGNSQLLRVPFGVISGAQEGPLLSHMRKVWSLQEPAFIKSLAPVQDAVMVPDSTGECLAPVQDAVMVPDSQGECLEPVQDAVMVPDSQGECLEPVQDAMMVPDSQGECLAPVQGT
ncbi:hypothetical protein CEUSTIGMA_g7836.t1 [Chlamydomonas eustigma]|uniref:Uncharacterized protein n=1 Tax=Chlamydomonas eustigma TaxID=1157962 RepID=A0A250XBE2_9CHLO|nr:hypothetical protein CEUSTIGMA_g7836.t1 [Chlamydomonas eustigma]|eukprot:GAX80397.1 hypothetical protein CEUSTIGMA_g7836.t1 [Chlamydomonas eustigma]